MPEKMKYVIIVGDGMADYPVGSLGVKLAADDIAFRCNLVTLKFQGNKTMMEDFSAGHITNEEARKIIIDLNKEMATSEIQFYAGVSYRHLVVLKNGAAKFTNLEKLEIPPPHDILGKEISPFLPPMNGPALTLMMESQRVLKNHPVNHAREAKGLLPATSLRLSG